MKIDIKNSILFTASGILMFLALYFLADFDIISSIFVSAGASFLTFILPNLKEN